jgi:hypothetical protein
VPAAVATKARTAEDRIHAVKENQRRAAGVAGATWNELVPLCADAKTLVAAGRFSDALGPLLGVALYGYDRMEMCNEEWLTHQMPDQIFASFFSDYSAAWQTVLEQSDEALGIAPSIGLAGGYRAELLEMLGNWEYSVNNILRNSFDEQFAEDGIKVRLKIVGAPEDYSEFEFEDDDDE